MSRRNRNYDTEKETIIQLVDGDLHSSKKVLQCVCAVAGAILGGGLVLAFPPAGAAMALGGTGSAIVGVSTAGVALSWWSYWRVPCCACYS